MGGRALSQLSEFLQTDVSQQPEIGIGMASEGIVATPLDLIFYMENLQQIKIKQENHCISSVT